jgi:hypothetical protein
MMIKTINVVFGALLTILVWCAVLLLAVVTFRALVIGAFTVYHLLHP